MRPGMRRPRHVPPAPGRKRRRRAVLALLIAALALWILWPAAAPQGADPLAAAPKPGGAKGIEKPDKVAEKAPDKTRPSRPGNPGPAPRPKTAEPSALLRARRDLLLAAIRARAASLRPCVPGDAAEVRVPVRLHVLRNGPVKGLEFPGEPPPRELRDCVRRIATGWNFQDVELPGDVELFATLALSPGA
jgi:hypothetical protein